jgi:hypothetical protein
MKRMGVTEPSRTQRGSAKMAYPAGLAPTGVTEAGAPVGGRRNNADTESTEFDPQQQEKSLISIRGRSKEPRRKGVRMLQNQRSLGGLHVFKLCVGAPARLEIHSGGLFFYLAIHRKRLGAKRGVLRH